jgi:nicotinic acetylcholine receptor
MSVFFLFRVSGPLPPPTDDSLGSTAFPPGAHRELSLILKEIKIITDKIRDDEESAAIENDWKFAAMVLDRLCLIIFTLFTIVATVAVLAAAPHVIVT